MGSDFKQLMAIIEQKVVDEGRWSDVQSVDNAVTMFEFGKSAISLPAKSSKGYTRRGASLAWATVFKHLSERRRTNKSSKSARNKRVLDEVSALSEASDEEMDIEEHGDARDNVVQSLEANARQPPKKRHANKNVIVVADSQS
jgi:hypothetical protein